MRKKLQIISVGSFLRVAFCGTLESSSTQAHETMTNSYHEDFFTDVQVAAMLGKHPVTVRKWRLKNKELGCIKYGPPYEFRGASVVYPKDRFSQWCSQVQMIDGVPHINLPVSATIALPKRVNVNEVADVA